MYSLRLETEIYYDELSESREEWKEQQYKILFLVFKSILRATSPLLPSLDIFLVKYQCCVKVHYTFCAFSIPFYSIEKKPVTFLFSYFTKVTFAQTTRPLKIMGKVKKRGEKHVLSRTHLCFYSESLIHIYYALQIMLFFYSVREILFFIKGLLQLCNFQIFFS